MLDLGFVRDNLPAVAESLRRRGIDPDSILRDFTEVNTKRTKAITEVETLKAQRNQASEEVAKRKQAGQSADDLIAQTKSLREKIEALEKTAEAFDAELRQLLIAIPNIPHPSVPAGTDASSNLEVRRWGTPPKFDFA